jgi:hypothetical protein
MPGGRRSSRRRAALAANVALALAGVALIALAGAMGQSWTDRHFLPAFAWPRGVQIGLAQAIRVLLALLGLFLLLFVRPRVARAVKAGRGGRLLAATLSAALAVVAALGVTEGVLRSQTWRATQERWGDKEPLRRRDDLTGWTFVPNHRGSALRDGRPIVYAMDRFGYRTGGAPLDLDQPTFVFAGESILLGYGLPWPETIPARVQASTGVQSANLSVNAYATDQILMRLRRELPRFRRPVAVVVPFVPMLFDRDLDTDRPHLDARLRWHAGRPPPLRLVELARRVLRYRSEAAIAEGVTTTQAVLRATIALARARGAQALIVVPQFQPEDPSERAIRLRVLDAGHIPYLLVPLDARWRLAADRHPDARGAEAIAAAVARRLAAR